jgi:hypothetical protein
MALHRNISSELDIPIGRDGRPVYNSQITTMGIGNLIIQVFTCPYDNVAYSYRIAAEGAGLFQLWPARYILWPIYQRLLQFPLKNGFSDNEIDQLSSSMRDRILATSNM